MNNRKKKKLILLLLIFCCCFVTVGYFALVRGMIIKGRYRINSSKWEIKFKSIESKEIIGNAKNIEEPKLRDYEIIFYSEFDKIGDSITYDVVIKNEGTLDGKLEDITFEPSKNDYIDYNFSGIGLGEVLKSGESVKCKVKLTYVNQSELENDLLGSIKLKLLWKQVV